jgi:putative inorganic carbon (hco3(-)) transporter
VTADEHHRLAAQTGWAGAVPGPMPRALGSALVAMALVVAAVAPVSPAVAMAVAAVVAIILNPGLGLAVLVFLTWSRLSDALISSVGAPSVAQPYVVFLLLVVIGRWFLLGEEPARWRQPAMLLFAYTLLGIGSLLYADGYEAAVFELVEFGKAALIFALTLSLVSDPGRLRIAVWALLAAGGLLGAVTVLQYVTGTFENTYWGLARSEVQHIVGQVNDQRASGPAVGPNGYAQIMLVLVPLAVERMLRDPWRWARPVAAMVAAVAAASVILTFSRQALIAAAAMLVATVVLTRIDLRKLAVAFAAAGLLVISLAPDGYTERLATLSDLSPTADTPITAEGSYRGRLSEYIVGVQMFADRPIAGMGLGNYNHHYQDYARPLGLESRRVGRSPHSLYLEFASELGVLGLAWFAALNVAAFRGMARSKRQALVMGADSLAGMITAFQVALIGYLATSIFRHMAFPRYFWLLYALVLAIPWVVGRLGEPDESTAPRPGVGTAA